MSRTVNEKNEADIRKLVYEGQKNMSQAQEAVIKHHQRQGEDAQQAGSSASSSKWWDLFFEVDLRLINVNKNVIEIKIKHFLKPAELRLKINLLRKYFHFYKH